MGGRLPEPGMTAKWPPAEERRPAPTAQVEKRDDEWPEIVGDVDPGEFGPDEQREG